MKATAATGETGVTRFRYAKNATIVTRDGEAERYQHGNGAVQETGTSTAPPSMTLSGSLHAARDTTLAEGTYALTVASVPGGTAADAGVTAIEIEADGERIDYVEQPCATGTCELSRTFTFDTNEFDEGAVRIDVRSRSTRGDEASETFLVVIPKRAPAAVTTEPAPPSSDQVRQDAIDFRQAFGLNSSVAHVDAVAADPANAPPRDDYGVPLTPAELSVVKTQDSVQAAKTVIDEYGSTQAPTEYAEQYVSYEEPAGLVNVGFTGNLAAHTAELKKIYPYPDRIRTFLATYSRQHLNGILDRVIAELDELAAQGVVVNVAWLKVKANRVHVGVDAPTAAQQGVLQARYGGAAVLVQEAAGVASAASSRFRYSVPKYAGQEVVSTGTSPRHCTLGFGMYGDFYTVIKAKGRLGPVTGGAKLKRARAFFLTAGHCAPDDTHRAFWRGGKPFAKVVGNTWSDGMKRAADAAVIKPRRRKFHSRQIFIRPGQEKSVGDVRGFTEDDEGDKVCYSGRTTGKKCGILTKIGRVPLRITAAGGVQYWLTASRVMNRECREGDSGAPVWSPSGERATAVAVVTARLPGACAYSQLEHARNLLNDDVEDLGVAVPGIDLWGR